MTTVTWDPTQEQVTDPDTIWLFDPTVESTLAPGSGGLIDPSGASTSLAACNPWTNGNFNTVAGKYRQGLANATGSTQNVYMPGIHLPARSFTLEGFWMSTSAWSSTINTTLLQIGSAWSVQSGSSCGLSLNTDGSGHPQLRAYSNQNGPIQTVSQSNSADTPGANTFESLALTYDGTNLKLYVAGVLRVTAAFTAVRLWSTDDVNTGLLLTLPAGWSVSDIRISRVCRNLAPATTTVTAASSAVVSATPAGTVTQTLRGGGHQWASSPSQVGNATIDALNTGYVLVARTDKFMSDCPVSGSLSATTPTLGHSGVYYYNFGPLDHTVEWYVARGVMPYLCFGSCPQSLGGAGAPFTLTECNDPTWLSGINSSYQPAVPNSFANFATLCVDFYFHVKATFPDVAIQWGFWNEPDGSSFWSGTLAQMYQLYTTAWAALHTADATIELLGPEGLDPGDWSAFYTYVAGQSAAVAGHSFHQYTGDVGLLAMSKTAVTAAVSAASLPALTVWSAGEWSWSQTNEYDGQYPWKNNLNMFVNAWMASFGATFLMMAQQLGFTYANYWWLMPTGATGLPGFGDLGSPASTTNAWATRNLLEMWGKLGASNVLALSSQDLENGVAVQASQGGSDVYVLAVNHKYRLDRTTTLQITLPAGYSVNTNYWLIDSAHSDYYDEQTDDGSLQSVAPVVVSNGVATLTMQPRSVHLLEFTNQVPIPPIPFTTFQNGNNVFPNQFLGLQSGFDADGRVQNAVSAPLRLNTENRAGSALHSGVGAPTIGGSLGDFYFRVDLPGGANENIYICTTGGTAGSAVWLGIL